MEKWPPQTDTQKPAFHNVVQALAWRNEELGQNTLEDFFRSTLGVRVNGRSEMKRTMGRWLTDDGMFLPRSAVKAPKRQGMYNGEISVYKGGKGKNKAILHLLEALCQMPDGQTMVLYDFDTRLFSRKNVMSREFQWRLRQLAQKNCHVEIIVFLGGQQGELHHLYELLLPIVGVVDTRVCYIYQPDTRVFDFVYYVKDKMMLLGKGAEKKADIYAGIVWDYLTVEMLAKHIDPLLEQAKPLFTQMVDEPLHKVLSIRQVRNLVKIPRDQYVIVEDVGLLAESCLNDEQVMLELNLTAEEENLANKYTSHKNQNLKKLLCGKTRTCIVLDLKRLKVLKRERRVEISALSELLGRPVNVASSGVIRQLWLFWNNLGNHIELAFRPEDMPLFCEGVNVWVKEDALLCFHQSIKPGTHIMINEFSTVNLYFERARHYWQSIPDVAKQKEYIDRQFELLLE